MQQPLPKFQMSPFDTKAFQALKKTWYAKLKSKGFEDAEQDEVNLKEWHSSIFMRDYDELYYKSKEDYYRLAGQFLHDFPFKNKKERRIWELHSQGISLRNIAKILSKRKKIKLNKDAISLIVTRLVAEMLIKCK